MHSRLRRVASIVATVALTLVGITVTSAPAQAVGIGSVTPEQFSFDRASTDGSNVVVNDGEIVDIYSAVEISPEWAGWPLKKGVKLSRTAFTPVLPAALQGDSFTWREWSGQASNDPEYTCAGIWSDAAGYTFTAADACVDDLRITDGTWARNFSGTSQTITTNAGAQILKNGKKDITTQPGVDSTLTGHITKRDLDSLTIASGESNLTMTMHACVDESLLSDTSEDLSISMVVQRGGSPLIKGTGYDLWDNSNDENVDLEAMTFTTPSAADYLEGYGTARENIEVNLDVTFSSTSAAAYTATIDLKNGSNQSVLEECPADGVASWGSVSNIDNGDPNITQNSRSLPTNVLQTKSNFDLYGENPDGFGGQFYWTYDQATQVDVDPAPMKIVHLGPTGATNDFNGSGYFTTTSGPYGQLDMGRYDVNGSKWYAINSSAGNWSVTTGSMSAGSPTTSTVTTKTLSKLCPTNFSANWLIGTPAPTANPLAFLFCGYKSFSAVQMVSLKSTGPTLVTSLGATTAKKPCLVPAEATNPNASAGTDVAFLVYTRVGGKDENGYCSAIGATVSGRGLTKITQAGVVTKSTIATNPWVDGVEPASVSMAPSNNQGSEWIGLTYTAEGIYDPSYADHTFTTDTAAISSGSSTIALDAGDDFGQWAYLLPVKKVGATSWLVALSGDSVFDGETTAKYTVGVLNTTTGQVANGDVGTMSGFGYYSGRIASRISIKSGTAAYWYTTTSASNYSVSSWAYTP